MNGTGINRLLKGRELNPLFCNFFFNFELIQNYFIGDRIGPLLRYRPDFNVHAR